jgi:hypothetical protein
MVMTKLSRQAKREISGLADLSRDALVKRWIDLLGREPPKRLTKDLLVRGIAYEIQAGELGGLTPAEKKGLKAMAAEKNQAALPKPKVGMRLYRSWQGITREVLVLETGYSWRDKSYGSLSEVARAITGTRWSGPRFFGVRRVVTRKRRT